MYLIPWNSIKKNVFVSFFMCLVFAISSQAFASAGGRVLHYPITHSPENEPINIETSFTTSVTMVMVNYRKPGDPAYTQMPMMLRSNGKYSIVIPSKDMKKGDVMEYYIAAETASGDVITYPEQNAEFAPIQIVITKKLSVQESGIEAVVLSPEPNSTIAPEDFFIAVSLFSETTVDLQNLRLTLDGEDITKKADVTAELVSFSAKGMAPGDHTVRLWYAISSDNIVNLAEWLFTVNKDEAEDIFSGKGFTSSVTSGGAASGGSDESSFDEEGKFRANFRTEYKGQNNLGVKTNYKRVGGELSYEKNWFKLGATLDIDSEDDFRKNQPLNRYLISANLKNILMLDYGDSYPTFSPVTLYGTRVRGLSAGVYLGIFNFQFVQGELNRKVISKADENRLDSIKAFGTNADGIAQYLQSGENVGADRTFTGTFKRNLLGGRFSVGPQAFQVGLSFTKVKDQQSSLDYNPYMALGYNGIAPKDNLVAGADFKMNLFNKRFTFDASIASSITNEDITGGSADATVFQDAGMDITQDDIDLLDKFITVNQNLAIPGDGKDYKNLFAYTIGGSINAFNNNFNTRYRSNGAYFQSLATPIARDMAMFEISDRVRLWQNRIFVTGSYATSENNLAKTNSNTLETSNLGFNVSLFLPKLPSLTVGINNIKRDNNFAYSGPKLADQLDNNARPEENVTKVLSISTSYGFNAADMRHNATLTLSNSKKDDKTQDLDTINYIPTGNAKNNSFGLSVSTEWNFPLRTSVNFAASNGTTQALDTNGVDVNDTKTTASTFGASGDYALLNKDDMKLNAYGGISLTSFKFAGDKTSLTTLTLGQRFNFMKNHTFYLDLNLTSGIKVPQYDTNGVQTGTSKKTNSVFTARYEFVF